LVEDIVIVDEGSRKAEVDIFQAIIAEHLASRIQGNLQIIKDHVEEVVSICVNTCVHRPTRQSGSGASSSSSSSCSLFVTVCSSIDSRFRAKSLSKRKRSLWLKKSALEIE